MTKNQKIAIAVGSGLLGAYAVIFVYQRIKRAQADASVVPANDALKILRENKVNNSNTMPTFSSEDSIPQVPNPDEVAMEDTGYIADENLTELQQWDVMSGMGDYNNNSYSY